MNRNEAATIMAILQVAFPAFYRNVTAADAKAAINLWAEMFADDPADQVAAAVKAIIAVQVEGFPPTIGAVKEKLRELRNINAMTAQEGWTWALKAAQGNVKWDDLPEPVKKAIGSQSILYEWRYNVDVEAFNTVIYSQFIKAFNINQEREVALEKLPTSVRQMISSVADSMKLIGPERNSNEKD